MHGSQPREVATRAGHSSRYKIISVKYAATNSNAGSKSVSVLLLLLFAAYVLDSYSKILVHGHIIYMGGSHLASSIQCARYKHLSFSCF